MKVLITAGGTFEPIDDVRGITNRSTGQLGAALANAFIQRGARVHLLASEALASRSEWLDASVRVTPFLSYSDLDEALHAACAESPDIVLMAAAVADYSPVPFPGKRSSQAAEQTLTLHRNPKLLASLARRCDETTRIIGFKLLSGVSQTVLIDTARKQIENHGLSSCVANDMQAFVDGQHPVTLVDASGVSMKIEGTKRETAEQLVDALLRPATS